MSETVTDVGKFQKIKRRVNLNADDKIMWFEELKDINGINLINSMPLSLSYFHK